MDATSTITAIVTAAVGGGGLGALIRGVYSTKRVAASQDGALAADILSNLVNKLLNDLSQSRTSEAVLSGQVGDLSARVETLESAYKERDEECDRAIATLTARVRKLERDGRTPPHGTPAVESSDNVRPPLMHEAVGGYRMKGTDS